MALLRLHLSELLIEHLDDFLLLIDFSLVTLIILIQALHNIVVRLTLARQSLNNFLRLGDDFSLHLILLLHLEEALLELHILQLLLVELLNQVRLDHMQRFLSLGGLVDLPVEGVDLALEIVVTVDVCVAELTLVVNVLLVGHVLLVLLRLHVMRRAVRLKSVDIGNCMLEVRLELGGLEGTLPLPYHLTELEFLGLEHLELGSQVVETLFKVAPLLQDLIDLSALHIDSSFKIGNLDVLVTDLELCGKKFSSCFLQIYLQFIDKLLSCRHILIFALLCPARRLHDRLDTIFAR